MRTSLKRILTVALALAVLCIAGAGYADPAKKIEASYDLESNELKIKVYHDTPSVTMHRISMIGIKIRGKQYAYNYDKQTSKEAHEVTLMFRDVAKGDKIEIEAVCNVFGKKSITLVAGEQQKAAKK